ncbi:paraquat-inducible protein B [Geothermobacter ehrlichii]|uniref:Paraquat-inducible protein B n=1 Tax=Geothermobacter ehrlichii TaxID=213224 RepID=A0A5D3WIH5_9BACT|nr:MlaD family protein [Geothermobacter ehrlichii]TYO95855.1 paraquat-inducible protein B [Geothermobacter ehrlichii]
MLRRADPKLIGAFVLGAMVLAIAGLVFFGKGGLLTPRQRYILYFDSSVKGLAVGAPVTFRGVRIGRVADISVRINPADYTFKIPVIIDIEPKRIEQIRQDGQNGDLLPNLNREDPLQVLIAKGLRGQLQLQSLITGQLFVQLDMYPDTEIVLSGYPSPYPEIPTIRSSLDELSQTLEKLPLQEIVDKVISTLDGLQELVHNADLADSLFKLNHGLDQLRDLLASLDRELAPTLKDFRAAARSVQQTADSIAADVGEMGQRTGRSLDQLDRTLAEARRLIAGAEKTLQGVEETGPQLRQMLEELHRTARSLRLVSDALNENPDMLLRGRGQEGGKP